MKIGIIIGSIIVAFVAGIFCFRFYDEYKVKDAYARRFLYMPRRLTDADWDVFKDTSHATSVPCTDMTGKRTMVALILGQSNAANSVNALYTPHHAVYAYYAHACYQATDPLPGASDSHGSTWTRLGDKLIEAGLYDKVLLVSIARQGSSILNWGRYGDLLHLVRGTVRDLKADGLRVTHVFFHQGEADCPVGMSGEDYRVLLDSFVRELRRSVGETPPIFIARASMYRKFDCPDNADPGCFATCPAITRAQTEAADARHGIFLGPDTDVVVPFDQRPDGYHFSGQGADAFAAAWLPILAGQRHSE